MVLFKSPLHTHTHTCCSRLPSIHPPTCRFSSFSRRRRGECRPHPRLQHGKPNAAEHGLEPRDGPWSGGAGHHRAHPGHAETQRHRSGLQLSPPPPSTGPGVPVLKLIEAGYLTRSNGEDGPWWVVHGTGGRRGATRRIKVQDSES